MGTRYSWDTLNVSPTPHPLGSACWVLKCPLSYCSCMALSYSYFQEILSNGLYSYWACDLSFGLASPQCGPCSPHRCSTSTPRSHQLMRRSLWTRPANTRTATTRLSATRHSMLWSRRRCSQNNCSLVDIFCKLHFIDLLNLSCASTSWDYVPIKRLVLFAILYGWLLLEIDFCFFFE